MISSLRGGLFMAKLLGAFAFMMLATPEGDDLGANLASALKTMQGAGQSIPAATAEAIQKAAVKRDATGLADAAHPLVFLELTINPEGRVRVSPGAAVPAMKAGVAALALVKVNNQSGGQQRLIPRCQCPGSDSNPFSVSMMNAKGGPADLIGRELEYMLVKVSCQRPGPREALFAFHAGQGTEDIGFRGETAVLFKVAD